MPVAQLIISALTVEGRPRARSRATTRSPDTGCSAVQRYEREGPIAFQPRSRRPHPRPHTVDAYTWRFNPPELLDIVGFTAKPSAPEFVERARPERRCLLRQKINFSQRGLNHLHCQLACRYAIRTSGESAATAFLAKFAQRSRYLASRSARPRIASPVTYTPTSLMSGSVLQRLPA
jgi:hypothetical protein